MGESTSSSGDLAAVKLPAMIIMFLITLGFGSIPLRSKAFKENKMVLALANAFSGGLFLAVGILHLLPEAAENFDNYYKGEKEDKGGKQDEKDEDVEHFPWAFLLTVLSFSLILFIEKIATNHSHSPELESVRQSFVNRSMITQQNQQQQAVNIDQIVIKKRSSEEEEKEIEKDYEIKEQKQAIQQTLLQNDFSNTNNNLRNQGGVQNQGINAKQITGSTQPNTQLNLMEECNIDNLEQEMEEEVVKETLNVQTKLARQMSFIDQNKSNAELENFDMTPYLLQVAVGIHALFEGIAIGIQKSWGECLGIAAAVIGHKWAEAMTLGISFRNANIPLQRSTIMIAIQAVMNPLGVSLGWILSDSGELMTGIFTSISAGTFVYIACMEVIVEEFALQRYKWLKFFMYLLAIGFVCCLWLFEQWAGE